MNGRPRVTIHLVCGLPGAGKTVVATALADRLGAIRFSLDEWTAGLFWMDRPEPLRFEWTIERVARCEAVIWPMVERLAKIGVASVLDHGFVTADHRQRFIDLITAAGFDVALHVLDVSPEERWRRVQLRNAEKGATYRLEVTREMFDFMESIWEPPTAAEIPLLAGSPSDRRS